MLIWAVIYCLFLLVGILSIMRAIATHPYKDGHLGWVASSFVCASFCVILPISVVAERYGVNKGIATFESTRATYQRSRESGISIENAAIQTDIAEANRWLTQQQFDNRLWDWWVPDAVLKMEPIR